MIARSQRAFTFDVIVVDLHNAATEIDNVAAAQRSGDLLRAPKIPVGAALRKYGKSHHTSYVG